MSKILIVGKNTHLRMFYELELQRQGYRTVACEKIDECPEYLEHETPDLVILDIQRSSRDGLETLRSMRSSFGAIPVILNSSFPDYLTNSLAEAADRCLIKSSDTAELMTAIECLLKERKLKWKTAKTPPQEQKTHSFRAAYSHGWQ